MKIGRLFDSTKVELNKLFVYIWLFTNHKKGVSFLQSTKDIGVTQKTAWFTTNRIRTCFNIDNNDIFDVTVEINEIYIGGKEKNKRFNKKIPNTKGRSTSTKLSILGMISREDNKQVKAYNV